MSKFFDCLGKQHEKPWIKNEVFVHSVVNIRHKNRRNVEKTDFFKRRKLRQLKIASKYYLNTLASFLSKAAQQYQIYSIPQNFLIDPEGKIVGKNLRGAALERKLAKVLR